MSSASRSRQPVPALGLLALVLGAGAASAASCGGKASSTTARDGGPSSSGGDGAGDEAAAADASMGGDTGAPGVDSSAMGETWTPADSGSGETGPIDAGPCGMRTGMRGLTSRSMMIGGLNRTYLIYLPASLDPTKPIPFVFVHHGLTMSGEAMYVITQYTDLADSEGIGVAFPDGQSGPNSLLAPWNVGANTCPSSVAPTPSASGDDFAFLDAMQADVWQDQCLDTSHLFVTGFSMGGFFAHQVACMKPNIRAVAPHSGGTHDLSTCTNGPKPIIIFHGAADPIIPDGCDDPNATNTPAGFTPSAKAWAARNGCSDTVTTMSVTNGTCSYYQGCPAGGQVALCVMTGMGHCWAGGAADGGIFSCPGFASATQLQWQFYKTYAW